MNFDQAVKASLSLTQAFLHAVREGIIHFSVKKHEDGFTVAVKDGLFLHATIKGLIEEQVCRDLGRKPASSEISYLRPPRFFPESRNNDPALVSAPRKWALRGAASPL